MEAIRRLEGVPIAPVAPQLLPPDALATRDVRHRVYSAMLTAAGLSARHRHALQARGLSDRQIDAAGYASWPRSARARLLAPMQATQLSLVGVPGIGRRIDRDRWRLEGMPGLLIPVRDRRGHIQACQIRTDQGASRYLWLSSAPDEVGWTGSSPGTPFHVAGHRYIRKGTTWWVTEGPLKADVIAAFMERPVVGIPGVALWPRLGQALSAWRPTAVILAFDQDPVPETRERVTQAQDQLGAVLADAGVHVRIAHWADGPKGLDDALLAGVRLTIVPWQASHESPKYASLP